MSHPPDRSPQAYWRANIRLVLILLAIWFAVSFGAGILLVDVFDAIPLGGFKLGFCFVTHRSKSLLVTSFMEWLSHFFLPVNLCICLSSS